MQDAARVALQLMTSLDRGSARVSFESMCRWIIRQCGGTVTDPAIRRLYRVVARGDAADEDVARVREWLMMIAEGDDERDADGEDRRPDGEGRGTEVAGLQVAEESSDEPADEGSGFGDRVSGFDYS